MHVAELEIEVGERSPQLLHVAAQRVAADRSAGQRVFVVALGRQRREDGVGIVAVPRIEVGLAHRNGIENAHVGLSGRC
jgi:hypothetical protein